MDDLKMQRLMNRVREDIKQGTATIYVSRETYAELHTIAKECNCTVSGVIDQMVDALERSRPQPSLAEVPKSEDT